MNQKEFAAKIGISLTTLNYYCKQKGMLEGQTGIEPEKCYDWFMKTGRTDMAAKVRKAFKFGAKKDVVELDKSVPKPRKVSVDETHPFHNLIKLLQDKGVFKFVLSGTVKDRQKVFEVFINYFKFDFKPFPVGKKIYCVVNKDRFAIISKKAYKECAFSEYFHGTDTVKHYTDPIYWHGYTLQDLLDPEKHIAIHLPTKEKAQKLSQKLQQAALVLNTGRSYIEAENFAYGSDTCLDVARGFYQSVPHFQNKEYKFISYESSMRCFISNTCKEDTLKQKNKEPYDDQVLHHSVSMKKTDSPMILKEILHFPEGSTAHPVVVTLDKLEELGRRFESFMVLLRELVGDIK